MPSWKKEQVEEVLKTAEETIRRRLRPFGFDVYTWWDHVIRGWVVRVDKTIDAPGHLWHGQRISQQFVLSDRDLYQGARVIPHIEHFVRVTTEDVLLTMMRLVDRSPQAAEPPDWRPQEMLPEDFYAM